MTPPNAGYKGAPVSELVCATKRSYVSRKDAAKAANNMRHRIYDRTGEYQPVKAYHCLRHHAWHIGTIPGWREENQRPRLPYKTN